MFTFKKAKGDEPNIDLTKIHSTSELHIMTANKTTQCSTCSKDFKNGDECQIFSKGSKMIVEHVRCPK